MAGSGRKKTGAKPPRGRHVPTGNTQAAPASEDADADETESLSEITDAEDASDEEAPADKGSRAHHAATKSARTASGAYRATLSASARTLPPAESHAAAAKSGRTAPAEAGELRGPDRGRHWRSK